VAGLRQARRLQLSRGPGGRGTWPVPRTAQ
jgi:hypothetical protein